MIEVLNNQNEDMMELENIKQNCYFQKTKFPQSQLTQLSNKKHNRILTPDFENEILAILNSQFYLIKEIGKGTTGSVYLSHYIKDSKDSKTFYAIKIIEQKYPNDICINSCEVNFLEKMNHKNILKVYGHGLGILETPDGLKKQVNYIIMDYLNHGSLVSQINGNIGFGEDFGRLIFAQLLDGLEAIHNSDIVHRDIKLENIMLSGDDYTLKYVDFGFAIEKSKGYFTEFLGTPNYAAPELHLKQPYLGVYEDIFSLGVTLFIIVTGHLPFLLALPNDPLYQNIVCVDYINYWRKRNIKVSPSFMELFDNLIAFDPSQRPSISEIKKSKWMQEINWNLLPALNQEFLRREEIKNKYQNMMKEFKMRNINDKGNNADEILRKMREEKKNDVINDIKKQLFSINNENENKNIFNENKINKNEPQLKKDKDNNNNSNKKSELIGFIKIKLKIKNLNSLIILLRQFLRYEGYNITKKDLENLNIEISNGEVDVLLLFEKIIKEIKISFSILNGNREDFDNFKKIMKKFKIKK